MRIKVFCTFQVEGLHRWPAAPEECEYLSYLHRHMFHVRVEAQVVEPDRQIEFIHLKHAALEAFVQNARCNGENPLAYHCGILDFGSMSCEMLAIATGDYLRKEFPNVIAVEVSEDGENGARVEFN